MAQDTDTSKRRPVHGAPARPPGYKPVSSIPAKFETVLFNGPRERKGFGSEGRRFNEGENEAPGPGTYAASRTAPTMQFQHESISKKGFGPMASKSARFKRRVVYTGPGPGDYKQRSPAELLDDKNFNRAPTTAAFQKQISKPVDKEAEPSPGPGEYTPQETRTGQKVDLLATAHSHVSAFKASSHKLTLLGNPDSPAPTKYTMSDLWSGPGSAHGASGGRAVSKAGTSSFAGRSMASIASVPPIIFLEQGDVGKPDTGPGPGTYELQYQSSIRTTLDRGRGKTSAAFQQPEYIDRFGRPTAPAPPGPGPADYTLSSAPAAPGHGAGRTAGGSPGKDRPKSPPKGVGAPFKSQSPGHGHMDVRELSKAPGPAYYKPSAVPDKKSFHLNARRQFVAAS